jgi:hypothetical protein
MSKTLDRGRDFGIIYGGDNGAAYEQDGVQFDGLGNAMSSDDVEVSIPKKRTGRPPKVAVSDVDSQVDAILNGEPNE